MSNISGPAPRQPKRQFSVDPVVPSFVLLVLLAFFGGIYAKGAFLTPPLPDLRAEYCRGYADGDQARYQVVYDVFDGVQKLTAEDGFERGLITRDPETGKESRIVPVTGEGGWLPLPDPELLGPKEDSCLQGSMEALVAAGLRGPSDETLPPTPTTTLMGGANIPENDE